MISTSELFDIGSGIKRICEENRLYLDALVKKDKEIERLQEALKAIRREIRAVCGDWREVSCIIDDLACSALQREDSE